MNIGQEEVYMAQDELILPTLTRYIDGYGWSFNMARRLINRTFGTEYTDKQLKRLYKKNKAPHFDNANTETGR